MPHDQTPWQNQAPKKNISKNYPDVRNWWQPFKNIRQSYVPGRRNSTSMTLCFTENLRMIYKLQNRIKAWEKSLNGME